MLGPRISVCRVQRRYAGCSQTLARRRRNRLNSTIPVGDGRGGFVQITLEPGRKNLLRLHR
jgi:hypothetical protein